jgi:site-specific DNA recombinase
MSRAAAIYARISEAPDGSVLGVERQVPPCEKLCAARGWTIIPDPAAGEQAFVDNDLSASRFARKNRPAYERMLDLVRDGVVTAIVVLDPDRLTRRPAENEQVIELAERYGLALANVAGDVDLSTATGRLQFRMLGAVAAHESELKSERVRRKMAQKALAGEDHGGVRAFGRADDRISLHPVEAPLVQRAVEDLLAGRTLKGIVADWNAAGITTTRGKPWGATTLRRMLLQPRLYGARQHNGQTVMHDAFPPIVPRETWQELRAVLTDPSRLRPGAPARYLLTGIASCYRCQMRLVGDQQRGRPAYGCRALRRGCGRMTVSAEPLEQIIVEAVIEHLAGPGLERARATYAAADPEYQRLQHQREEEERALSDLAHARFVERSVEHHDYLRLRAELEGRFQAADRAVRRRAKAGILAKLRPGEDALRADWAAHADDLEWQRAVIMAVCDRVIVGPGRPQRFDKARILPPYGPQWIA